MLKNIIISLLLFMPLLLEAQLSFEQRGVWITLKDKQNKPYQIHVKRDIPKECKNIPITNNMLWTDNYANKKVPNACKSTYVHTKGRLLPIDFADKFTCSVQGFVVWFDYKLLEYGSDFI